MQQNPSLRKYHGKYRDVPGSNGGGILGIYFLAQTCFPLMENFIIGLYSRKWSITSIASGRTTRRAYNDCSGELTFSMISLSMMYPNFLFGQQKQQ